MSIPLDKIYYYIEGIAKEVEDNVVIYQFYPHGSKNINNLVSLRAYDWPTEISSYHVICNDQEPLNFDFYQDGAPRSVAWATLLSKYNCYENRNFSPFCIFDQQVLLHSEKKSKEIAKYQSIGLIPVYYWSHAFIALDWFRYAQHQSQIKNVSKTFLIYNRAWAGTREYRLKFAELLITKNLLDQCQTYLNCTDPESNFYYATHKFQNQIWKPKLLLENYFESTKASSLSSANFEIDDYQSTLIEVVLETLFDDTRIHLTEKILRPIACGQPFILMGTAGSLGYLRDYGFKTFDSIWNEQYDNIQDPFERMQAVIDLMNEIKNWSPEQKFQKMHEAYDIANHNKKHFFSEKFFDLIDNELKTNLGTALNTLTKNANCNKFIRRRIELCKHKEIKSFLTGQTNTSLSDNLPPNYSENNNYMNKKTIMQVLKKARKFVDSSALHLRGKSIEAERMTQDEIINAPCTRNK